RRHREPHGRREARRARARALPRRAGGDPRALAPPAEGREEPRARGSLPPRARGAPPEVALRIAGGSVASLRGARGLRELAADLRSELRRARLPSADHGRRAAGLPSGL